MPRIGFLLAFLLLGSAASAATAESVDRAPENKPLRLAQNNCKDRLPGQAGKNGQPSDSDCPIDTSPGSTGGAAPDEQHILFAQYSFSSPLFWVEEGALYGRSYVRAYLAGGDVFFGGIDVGEINQDTWKVQQELRYGITDDLSADVLLSYVSSYKDTFTPTGGAPFTETYSGFENPVFNLRYRLLWQDRDPIFLYLDANYTPNLISTNDPAPGRHGSVASGRTAWSAGPQVGYTVDDFIFIGSFKQEYRTRGRTGSKAFGSEWNSVAGLDFFHHLSPYFGYKLTGQYLWGTSRVNDDKVVAAQLVYSPIPNRLQFSAFLERTFIGVSEFPPISFSEIRGHQQDFVGLNIEYLFAADD